MAIETFMGAIALAASHLLAGNLRFLNVIPRSRWLSIAGGVAVAYAIVHLLPELQGHHEVLRKATANVGYTWLAEHLLWLLVLLGLVVFYGLEKAALYSKGSSQENSRNIFWLHIVSYGVYNALLGYLLVQEDRGVRSLVLYLIGIGLHFLINDYGLRQHHKKRYRHVGRWVLSASILVGWAVGVSTAHHEALTASVIAFLAGGILLNTFKEELPQERESRFWAFAVGAFGYAFILLAI
jgi:hypothetical protein